MAEGSGRGGSALARRRSSLTSGQLGSASIPPGSLDSVICVAPPNPFDARPRRKVKWRGRMTTPPVVEVPQCHLIEHGPVGRVLLEVAR